MFKIIKIVLVIIKQLKLFCHYSSYEVLYGGHIYNLYVDAVVVSARYVCVCVCVCVCVYIWPPYMTSQEQNNFSHFIITRAIFIS
jgi:hypothetical protein